MSKTPESNIEVGLGIDAGSIQKAMSELSKGLADLSRQMKNVGIDANKAAQDFKKQIDGTVRGFNQAYGQLDRFNKIMDKPRQMNNRVSGALAGAQVREDAARYGAQTTKTGILFERELAQQRLLNAQSEKQKNIELDNLKILERKLRVAQSLLSTETKAAQVAAKEAATIDKRLEKLKREEDQIRRNLTLQGTTRGNFEQPGMFGKFGLGGVFARTAAYGAAGTTLFSLMTNTREGLAFTVQWEDALKKLAAVANATQPEMAEMAKTIDTIGRESRFSLLELTEAATKLAQAGVSVGQMGDALRSVSTLAAASGSTLAEAGDLVTASLGSFQLQASETARVADLMTGALNRTRLTVQQAALAIQYVGATAYEQNITMEQLLATAAALSQAGIRSGSTIGTGMRQFLVDLQSPSDKLTEQLDRLGLKLKDVDVTTRGFLPVMKTLDEAGFGAAQAYGSLETRAAAFYLVARNNRDLMSQLIIDFAESGAAAEANERAMNSLTAQWQRFKNILGESFAGDMAFILEFTKQIVKDFSDALVTANKNMADFSKRRKEGFDGYVDRDGGFIGALKYLNENLLPDTGQAIYKIQNALLDIFLAPTGYQMGQEWDKYLQGARDSVAVTEALTAEVNKKEEAVAKTTDKIGAMTKEIDRLITQEKDLDETTGAVTGEIVTAMGRFEGLSSVIDLSTQSTRGLIEALRELRGQDLAVLIEELSGVEAAARTKMTEVTGLRDNKIQNFKNTKFYKEEMTRPEKAALENLDSPDAAIRAQSVNLLRGVSQRFAKDPKNKLGSTLLDPILTDNAQVASARNTVNLSRTRIGDASFQITPLGKQMNNMLEEVTNNLNRLRTAEGPEKESLERNIRTTLGILNKTLPERLAISEREKTPWKEYIKSGMEQTKKLESSLKDVLTPKKDSSSPNAEKGTNIPAAEMAKRLQEAFPGIVISSARQRTPADGAIYNPNSLHAKPGGNAIDVTRLPKGVTPDNVIAFMEAQGVTVPNTPNGFLDEFRNPSKKATGGHYHFGWTPKASTRSARAQRQEDAAKKAQEREQKRAEREAVALERLAMQNAERLLTSNLGTLKYATDSLTFDIGVAATWEAFDAWEEQVKKTAEAELKRRDATPAEIQTHMAEVNEKITQKRSEVEKRLYDSIIDNFERGLKVIDREIEAKLAPSQQALSDAQGRLEGLSSYSLQKRGVPDHVSYLAQQSVAREEENARNARRDVIPEQIARYRQRADTLQAELAAKGLDMDPLLRDDTQQRIEDLRTRITGLTQEWSGLNEAINAGSQIPLTLAGNLDKAIEAYSSANRLGQSFKEMLGGDMMNVLGQVHSGIQGFFTDIITGTQSVLGAFKNFVKSMLQMLGEMVAKFIASKVFQWMLSMFAGPTVYGGQAAADRSMVGDIPGMLHGGAVGAFNGRVMNGSPGRDSVHAKLAKGEFVVRKAAVDSVGVDFMRQLNDKGARAIRPAAIPMAVAPKQEMKVYLVAPDQKPQMGPADVLIALQDDILRDGQTKRLIRYVAQGG